MFDKCRNLVFRVVLSLALLGAVSAAVGLGARAAAHRAQRTGAVHSIEKAHFAPKFSRAPLIVGNGKYPGAYAPRVQPTDDVRAPHPGRPKARVSVVQLDR